MEARTLFIPVTNSEQVVEVRSDELPDEVEEILDILRAEVEAVPLPLWVDFAVRRRPTAGQQQEASISTLGPCQCHPD